MSGIFYNEYPYTDFHQLNLTWLINELTTVKETVEKFVSINALKYADPIQWDITTQYEKNTIVIDPQTGTAYISVQPVPSGVSLANTDYWTVVFDLGSFVVRAAKNFTSRYEEDTTLTATFPTNVGEWLVWGDTLYRAKVNITAGDAYVVDSNIEKITMEEIKDEIMSAMDALYTEISDRVGDLADLTTSDISSIVNAINSIITERGSLSDLTTSDVSSIVNAINSIITERGSLSDLTTSDVSSIVNAINSIITERGALANLTTTDKDSIVDAINELDSNINDLFNRPKRVFYVSDYGAVGDGITDDTTAIQNAINAANGNGLILFDPLTYLVSSTITITSSFITLSGYIDKQRQINPTIIANFTSDPVIAIGDGVTFIEGVTIDRLNVTRTSMGVSGSKTISVNYALYTVIKDSGFSLSQYGLYLTKINGALVDHCHGTTGGDLTANDNVYGIYVDGSNSIGNSGLIIKGYVYYGYDTPNSISHGIGCTATAQGGDIRIYDVECSGDVNYGIEINTGSGFSNDIIIDGLSMDSVISSGIYLHGTANYNWQNCNISNVWLLLNNSTAHGISGLYYQNISIVNCSINGAQITATDMDAIYLENCNNFNITNLNVNTFANKLMQITNCICGQVTGLISQINDCHAWVATSTGILFENCYINGTIFCGLPNTNCYKNNCIDASSNTAIKVNLTEGCVNSGKGGTHQFAVKINGITETSNINWYVNGGRSAGTSINSSGLLTIGSDESQLTLFVVAQSTINTDVRDICIVNVY